MVSGKSRIIGLVVAYLQNQFYPEALEKLSSELQERGYHVLVFLAASTAALRFERRMFFSPKNVNDVD